MIATIKKTKKIFSGGAHNNRPAAYFMINVGRNQIAAMINRITIGLLTVLIRKILSRIVFTTG